MLEVPPKRSRPYRKFPNVDILFIARNDGNAAFAHQKGKKRQGKIKGFPLSHVALIKFLGYIYKNYKRLDLQITQRYYADCILEKTSQKLVGFCVLTLIEPIFV